MVSNCSQGEVDSAINLILINSSMRLSIKHNVLACLTKIVILIKERILMLPFSRTFSQLVILGTLIAYPAIANSKENTTAILISFQKVKLNNKNKPVNHTLSKLWGNYTLLEAKTGKKPSLTIDIMLTMYRLKQVFIA